MLARGPLVVSPNGRLIAETKKKQLLTSQYQKSVPLLHSSPVGINIILVKFGEILSQRNSKDVAESTAPLKAFSIGIMSWLRVGIIVVPKT